MLIRAGYIIRWLDSSSRDFVLAEIWIICFLCHVFSVYKERLEYAITIQYWRSNVLYLESWQYRYLSARFIQNESEILHISLMKQPLPVYMRMKTLLWKGSKLGRTFSRNNAYRWVEILKLYGEQCDGYLQCIIYYI